MTTIVYCHKKREIAVDGRVTAGTVIVTDSFDKCIKRDGHYFFLSCGMADMDNVVNAYLNKAAEWAGANFTALIETPDHRVLEFYNVDSKLHTIPVTYNAACGSGGDWALAALDFGCTALDAVKYAMKKDSGTGGDIYLHQVPKQVDVGSSDVSAHSTD